VIDVRVSISMGPRFLTLSAEILVEILANLQLRDITACKLTCRTLRDVIVHSSLIQYIAQAFLAGVHDPLIPGASIAERSTALQDLEKAWHDLDVRNRTAHITRGTAWPWLNYIIHDDYLLAVRGDSDNPAQPPGYSYIDIRQSPPFTNLLWRRIDVAWHGQHCVFAFAAEENNLAVVVTCVCLSFI
jgi:F-box domain